MRSARRTLGLATLAAGVLLGGGGGVSCGGESGDAGPDPAPAEDPLDIVRRDDRIAPLLGDCGVTNVYDVATSDMLPRMVEKLERGHLDPLKRAKEELGNMGAPAVPALQRFIERHYSKLYSSAYVENALDAFALSDAAEARQVILHCLDHPQESVRLRAGRTLLAGHALPEDFDAFLTRFEGGETYMMKQLLAKLLHVADPPRAKQLYLQWIRDGEHRTLHTDVVALFASATDPDVAAQCGELFPMIDEPWRASLAAPAARAGHAPALAYLEGVKEAPQQNTRVAAAQAMVEAGLTDVLVDWLLEDPDEFVRAKAAEGLANMEELGPRHHDALVAAMDDDSPRVSGYALQVLCARDDPGALDRALTYLRLAETVPLQNAIQALRDPLSRDPEVVARTWETIHARAESEKDMPVSLRTATFKALGIVPLPEAAEYLYRVGLENTGEEIEGLRAHRWLMIYAGNTGDAGRGRLAELLDQEDDPLRRLDLIQAIGSTRSTTSRLALQRICEETNRSPYEVLLCASLLVKIGPADEVADRLKRVYFRLGSGETYRALECLLWEWY